MPLFGSQRDASAITKFNREILQSIVSSEIALYKIAPNETKQNIYGEATLKSYYAPVRIFAHVTLAPTQYINSSITNYVDALNTIQLGFIREDLVDLNIVVEVSDIIQFNNQFYQIDAVSSHELWFNRDPDTAIGQIEGDYAGTGYNTSVLADAHLTTMANLNIVETRTGVPKLKQLNIPKDI